LGNPTAEVGNGIGEAINIFSGKPGDQQFHPNQKKKNRNG